MAYIWHRWPTFQNRGGPAAPLLAPLLLQLLLLPPPLPPTRIGRLAQFAAHAASSTCWSGHRFRRRILQVCSAPSRAPFQVCSADGGA
eukprot:SAG31_NODE_1121_length_9797_cov_16.183749_7_plen_88_part_00